MKMSKGYEDEQRTLQAEADIIQNELQKEEKKSVDVKRFLAVVKKYTDLTELTPEILHEFVDRIIVHAPDKSSGRRLQEIEIIYNHIGEFDRSKVTLWKGNAVAYPMPYRIIQNLKNILMKTLLSRGFPILLCAAGMKQRPSGDTSP